MFRMFYVESATKATNPKCILRHLGRNDLGVRSELLADHANIKFGTLTPISRILQITTN